MDRIYEIPYIEDIEASKIKSSEIKNISKKTKIFYNNIIHNYVLVSMVYGA